MQKELILSKDMKTCQGDCSTVSGSVVEEDGRGRMRSRKRLGGRATWRLICTCLRCRLQE